MITNLMHNSLAILAAAAIMLDTILGLLRAGKERKFNSSAGINGAIRKAAMMVSILALAFVDNLIHFNALYLIPQNWRDVIGLQKAGLCEFFALLFILYESTSILKNMVLCGLPVPEKIRKMLSKFLTEMTQEMPK